MTNILNRLFKREEAPPKSDFEFIKFRKSLLNSLVEAHKKGTLIGIYSNVLGDGMFVTGVEDIYEYEGDHIVHLKRYDVLGSILIRNTIALSEIKAVCVFDMPYRNPTYSNAIKTSRH
jgi:hypothetical protein